MSVNNAAFIRCAEDTLRHINRYGNSGIGNLENAIYYDVMSHRDTSEKLKSIYDAFYRAKEADYFKTVGILSFSVPAAFGEAGAWFGVGYKLPPEVKYVQSRQRVNVLGNVFAITHKEYFTFMPTSDNPNVIYEEVIRFVKTLPLLHSALYPLNFQSQPPDGIQMKIPVTLKMLYGHPDSLVVHYRNSSFGDYIRETVMRTYSAAGVKLGRSIKANRGFDVEFEKDGGKVSKSHSELVARVMAKHILQHSREFGRMSVPQLAEWEKKTLESVSKWTIEQILRSI